MLQICSQHTGFRQSASHQQQQGQWQTQWCLARSQVCWKPALSLRRTIKHTKTSVTVTGRKWEWWHKSAHSDVAIQRTYKCRRTLKSHLRRLSSAVLSTSATRFRNFCVLIIFLLSTFVSRRCHMKNGCKNACIIMSWCCSNYNSYKQNTCTMW